MLRFIPFNDNNGFLAGWSASINGFIICHFLRSNGWNISEDRPDMERHIINVLSSSRLAFAR